MLRRPRYSVLMSVYAKEESDNLRLALDSIIDQTQPPEEILLVEDGPLPDALHGLISEYAEAHPGMLTIVPLKVNCGLGKALSQGVLRCRNEIIARMDSDDYSSPERMEVELRKMDLEHLDLVGSQVTEFIGDMHHPIARTDLPVTQTGIREYSKRRNPFRHPSVIFRKGIVEKAGNYNGDYPYFEDWDLFNRIIGIGGRVGNIDKPLVAMRVSEDFYVRRGGFRYLSDMWRFKYGLWRRGYSSFADFCISTFPHMIICLLPNRIRRIIYTQVLRKEVEA